MGAHCELTGRRTNLVSTPRAARRSAPTDDPTPGQDVIDLVQQLARCSALEERGRRLHSADVPGHRGRNPLVEVYPILLC